MTSLTQDDAARRPARAARPPRDDRIDVLRGLALLIIFIDHIPENVVALFTLRNFGFSDASEWFIFLSGYSSAYVFRLRQARGGPVHATVEMLRRVWTLYVAHIFVFVLYTAQVSFTAARLNNPMYFDELNLSAFLQEPHVAVVEALLLRFQPPYLDILPLYIVLMIAAPLVLLLPGRLPWLWIAASAGLYLLVQLLGWHLEGYPDQRPWTFNPLGWQALFTVGAVLGSAAARQTALVRPLRWLTLLALAYLAFSFAVALSWTIAGVWPSFPALLDEQLFPLDKSNLSPWRFAHILALVYLIWSVTRSDQALFRSPWLRPVVLCGRHSLNVFCLGVFLSMLGDVALTQLGRALPTQLAVNLAGCAILIGTAAALERMKAIGKAPAPAGAAP